jgi:hypothetical protein
VAASQQKASGDAGGGAAAADNTMADAVSSGVSGGSLDAGTELDSGTRVGTAAVVRDDIDRIEMMRPEA